MPEHEQEEKKRRRKEEKKKRREEEKKRRKKEKKKRNKKKEFFKNLNIKKKKSWEGRGGEMLSSTNQNRTPNAELFEGTLKTFHC